VRVLSPTKIEDAFVCEVGATVAGADYFAGPTHLYWIRLRVFHTFTLAEDQRGIHVPILYSMREGM